MEDLPPTVPVVAQVEECEMRSGTVRLVGVVSDRESSDPLPSANVSTLDGRTGVATDIDGRFTLDGLALSDTLRVSFVSFQEARYSVADLVASNCAPVP